MSVGSHMKVHGKDRNANARTLFKQSHTLCSKVSTRWCLSIIGRCYTLLKVSEQNRGYEKSEQFCMSHSYTPFSLWISWILETPPHTHTPHTTTIFLYDCKQQVPFHIRVLILMRSFVLGFDSIPLMHPRSLSFPFLIKLAH